MEFLPSLSKLDRPNFFVFNHRRLAEGMQLHPADEVARIGALSKGSNGQRSLESAPLHFLAILNLAQNLSRLPKGHPRSPH
jgi:hypothetical protein